MKFWLTVLILLLISSCATKYVLPGNKFITPESQGGFLESQFEVQQTAATDVSIDGSHGTVTNGLLYDQSKRTGYQFSTSFMNALDFYWTHTTSSNSMLGAKFQILGGSRTSRSAGNKLAIAAAFGENKHTIEGDPSTKFTLKGTDFSFIHGYRFNEYVLLYDLFSYSTYNFDGTVYSSNTPSINGAKPGYTNKLMGLYLGAELSAGVFFGKLEYGYQIISSNNTKNRTAGLIGYSLGFSW